MAANKVVYGTLVLMDLTSDTVTADDLAKGVTCHDKSGNPITGTLTENDALKIVSNSQAIDYYVNTTYGGVKIPLIKVSARFKPDTNNEKTILNGERTITINNDASNFGNATAADVAVGKTFTSKNGLAITGTLDMSGSDKVYTITDPSNPAVGIPDGYVQIYGYAKDSSYLYSFCGNKYYIRTSKGLDRSIRTTFSVTNGVIARFPSGLTECNLIAVQSS